MGKLRSSGRSAMVETYLVGVCQLKITSFQTSRNDFASKESLFFNRIINNYIIYRSACVFLRGIAHHVPSSLLSIWSSSSYVINHLVILHITVTCLLHEVEILFLDREGFLLVPTSALTALT